MEYLELFFGAILRRVVVMYVVIFDKSLIMSSIVLDPGQSILKKPY